MNGKMMPMFKKTRLHHWCAVMSAAAFALSADAATILRIGPKPGLMFSIR